MLLSRIGCCSALVFFVSLAAGAAPQTPLAPEGKTGADQLLILPVSKDKQGYIRVRKGACGLLWAAPDDERDPEGNHTSPGLLSHPLVLKSGWNRTQESLRGTAGACEETEHDTADETGEDSADETGEQWMNLVYHRGCSSRCSSLQHMTSILVPLGAALWLLADRPQDSPDDDPGLRSVAGKTLLAVSVGNLFKTIEELMAEMSQRVPGHLLSPQRVSQLATQALRLGVGRLDPVNADEQRTLGGVVRASAQYGFVHSSCQLLGEACAQLMDPVMPSRLRDLSVPVMGASLAGTLYSVAILWIRDSDAITDFRQGIAAVAALGISKSLLPLLEEAFADMTDRKAVRCAASYASLSSLSLLLAGGLSALGQDGEDPLRHLAQRLGNHLTMVGGWAFTNILGEPFLKHATAGSPWLPAWKLGSLLGSGLLAQVVFQICEDHQACPALAKHFRNTVQRIAIASGSNALIRDATHLVEASAQPCLLRLCSRPTSPCTD